MSDHPDIRQEDRSLNVDLEIIADERAELHHLAAFVDEMVRVLVTSEILTRAQVQEIENRVSARTGSPPRAW